MQYQDCVAPAQPSDHDAQARRLSDANINPTTGLATDYLNHFNEAIMLLEMLSGCPECRDDILAWRPMSYREHFAASRFAGRDLAIAAYETADPALRQRLDILAGAMNAVLEATRAALTTDLSADLAGDIAGRAAALLRPLAARTGAVINGQGNDGSIDTPQAVVDVLMQK